MKRTPRTIYYCVLCILPVFLLNFGRSLQRSRSHFMHLLFFRFSFPINYGSSIVRHLLPLLANAIIHHYVIYPFILGLPIAPALNQFRNELKTIVHSCTCFSENVFFFGCCLKSRVFGFYSAHNSTPKTNVTFD